LPADIVVAGEDLVVLKESEVLAVMIPDSEHAKPA
jgi:hypothetical protein